VTAGATSVCPETLFHHTHTHRAFKDTIVDRWKSRGA
jgi:hypothetical protein